MMDAYRGCEKCGFWCYCDDCSKKIAEIEAQGYEILQREDSVVKVTSWRCKKCGKLYLEKKDAIECC